MKLVVVYSTDDNYAQHTGVSIISLLENNKHAKSIDIYIIENEISESNKNKLNMIVQNYLTNIQYIDFTKYKQKLNLNMEWNISISSYARLFISSMLPNTVDKVLYFDCDTVIVNKLDELWNLDISDYYLAAVQDTVSNKTKNAVGIDNNYKYINAGMLLINLKKWREENIQQKFMDFIDKHNGNVIHHDQGVINGVLHKEIKVISLKYNLMTVYYIMKRKNIIRYYNIKGQFYSQSHIDEALSNPIFIHYTPAFTTRPWIEGCKHPLKYQYEIYLLMTPWKKKKNSKDNRKVFQKIIDESYRILPFKVANIISNLFSFLEVIVKGKLYE